MLSGLGWQKDHLNAWRVSSKSIKPRCVQNTSLCRAAKTNPGNRQWEKTKHLQVVNDLRPIRKIFWWLLPSNSLSNETGFPDWCCYLLQHASPEPGHSSNSAQPAKATLEWDFHTQSPHTHCTPVLSVPSILCAKFAVMHPHPTPEACNVAYFSRYYLDCSRLWAW